MIQKLLREKRQTTMTHLQYLSCVREYAPGKELYMREVHFLMEVSPTEGSTASELAAALDVTQGAVSQLAARLEQKGLILRTKASPDKRKTLITLTESGLDLHRRHQAYDRERFVHFSQIMSDYDTEALNKLIEFERTFRQALSTNM